MRLYPSWAVLAPGSPSWVEKRARIALRLDDEDDEDEYFGVPKPSSFTLVQGTGHYHLLYEMEATEAENEMLIAERLSRECREPVYAIEEGSGIPLVREYRDGKDKFLDIDPGKLAQSLGCPFPEEPPGQEEPPLTTVALVVGVDINESFSFFEGAVGFPPPPNHLHFLDNLPGFALVRRKGFWGFSDITLCDEFPQATVYGVTASPNLDRFFATLYRGSRVVAEFAHPVALRQTLEHPVSEIKGASTPEGILAALGIRAEWFW